MITTKNKFQLKILSVAAIVALSLCGVEATVPPVTHQHPNDGPGVHAHHHGPTHHAHHHTTHHGHPHVAKATPQYYTGLAKVTPVVHNDERVFLVDFGDQIAEVIDRPERKHAIVNPEQMVGYINTAGEPVVVMFRDYKHPQHKFEFTPQGPWEVGSEGVTLRTGWHEHHHPGPSSQASEHGNADLGTSTHGKTKSSPNKGHKNHHHKHHKHLWQHLTHEKSEGLMTVTALMYKGEGEQDFFVTPKEFEFSPVLSSSAGKHAHHNTSSRAVSEANVALGPSTHGKAQPSPDTTPSTAHIMVKLVHPMVEAISFSTHHTHHGKKGHKHSADHPVLSANHPVEKQGPHDALWTPASAGVVEGGKHHPHAHAVTKKLSMAKFDHLWKSKAANSFGKDKPNGFVWADFGTHAVLMTVIIGAPHGEHIPLTIMDAHVVSDQGTQHIKDAVDMSAVAQLLIDGKKAKGVMFVDYTNGACAPNFQQC